ncbi:C3-degrading proteinase [Streptococcus sp. DD10]|uniref:CppA N-terminal domain-containing protein n=1 Tax=Streptococcus sp. DD10 TaxID=1777878 RepID=UPI00079AE482|nr:CppA N-terminal domain-containing protein [Streptococcus sp. DD10]KXT72832.1 C3-degrading proteinase [Streptococcus sp. DD10]
MNVNETAIRLVPTLKCNNRKRSLAFFTENLGMTLLLEESAWSLLGDKSKCEKLTLEESPANRTRQVNGLKKLAKLVLKVANPEEIESLLARGASYTKLYHGEAGYAFESLSPEGDCILLHAEEQLANLVEVNADNFHLQADFTGLTTFEVEQVVLHVPDKTASQAFYDQFFAGSDQLAFVEASGADLELPTEVTWDLSQLKFVLQDLDVAAIKAVLPQAFVPKNEKFVSVLDPSKIELWFEA